MFNRKTKKLVKILMKKYSLKPRTRWEIYYPREEVAENLPRKSNTFNFQGRTANLYKCQCCAKTFPATTSKICIICMLLLQGEFGINSEYELNEAQKNNPSHYDNIIENLTKIATCFPTK